MGFNDIFFGPLNKDYCVIFYVFTIISFIGICLAIVGGIGFAVNKPKLITMQVGMSGLLILLNLMVVYFIYRLFHTMCIKSL